MEALSLTLRSVFSDKARQVQRQKAQFEKREDALRHLLDFEPNELNRLKAMMKSYDDSPLMPQINNSNNAFIIELKQFMAQDVPDPCAPIHRWERRLKGMIDAQYLRYQYAVLYQDILQEWQLRSTEPEPLIGDTSSGSHDLSQSKEEYRKIWESNVFVAKETDQNAIADWLQGFFISTKDNTQALKTFKGEIARFEKSMKKEKKHFTQSTFNWCILGLLTSDLLTDGKKQVLTAMNQDPEARGDIIDVLNMRMNTLDDWTWPEAGVSTEQRWSAGAKYRFFHDEDLMDALLLRYIGVKWSVRIFKSLTTFAKSQPLLSQLNLVSNDERKRREDYFGAGKDHRFGVQGGRLATYEADFFLAQLLKDEQEIDREYDQDYEQEETNWDNDQGSEQEDEEGGFKIRKSPAELNVLLLQLLSTEVAVAKGLDRELVVLQSDFKSFGPSIPHSTIAAVLSFFGVSRGWIEFFMRALEMPIIVEEEGVKTNVRVRKRGTPNSSPLADCLSELMLFCLDYSCWQRTSGLRLYRLHDDFWLWGNEDACVRGWSAMMDFAKVMGLELNKEKTGCVRVSKANVPLAPSLPLGDVRWGFLRLSRTGDFLLDDSFIDIHISRLITQLALSESVFAWIRIWNSYGVKFVMSKLGGDRPANSFGAEHIARMQRCFARIHKRVFEGEGNVASYLRRELKQRFPSCPGDVPDAFIFLPAKFGGLGVYNPFIKLRQLEGQVSANPNKIMDDFCQAEVRNYQIAKAAHCTRVDGSPTRLQNKDRFPSFANYTRDREHLSCELLEAYELLRYQPRPKKVEVSHELENMLKKDYEDLKIYPNSTFSLLERYKDELEQHYGGLQIVEARLLPMGMVSAARRQRIKWKTS
ncbi:MAG: hypothetical protein LQ337_002612 [Flavoplaca oasis]|nr:MAG: hypothetical protein LQ337_002612 [Flavoplaca oasis]